ncbi:MAG: ACT domain-containing protein [Limisphaerales bacterium]
MKLKQLSLFLENKPGALSAPVKLLAGARINILTLSIAEGRQYGILRLIVQDWEAAKKLLEKHGLVVNVTDVLAIEVANHPGGLAEVLAAIEDTGINLEYMYAFPFKRDGKGLLLFRFNDPDKAAGILQKKKINVVGNAELFKWLEGSAAS